MPRPPALYVISLLLVFLSLAALYESWTIPFVNLLMIPLGLVGAVTAVTLRVLPNDIYLQIGLLTTAGLSTKNAILIIQFIKEQMSQGHELVEATLSAETYAHLQPQEKLVDRSSVRLAMADLEM